jgi:hypothetical protein
MDDNMNPATTVDPKAASQQGTLDSFSSTPRYVRLPHVVHDSRGGRGLPFECPSLGEEGDRTPGVIPPDQGKRAWLVPQRRTLFARLTASPHFHQDTQGRGGLAAAPDGLAPRYRRGPA